MNKTGPKFSAQDKQAKQQQQKQKKRLSFRDPEVEGPQQHTQLFGGCRPKALTPAKTTPSKRSNTSPGNISLEDQALQIAQSVGSAFSGLTLQTDSFNSSSYTDGTRELLVETNFDEFPEEDSSFQKRTPLNRIQLLPEDQDYLEKDLIMRCPSIQPSDDSSAYNSIPAIEPIEEKLPSSAQHQIQLLKYQLDQQSQQTQMALYQVQLLTDQMEAECAARHKAQEQNNQLMVQNQYLLSHIEKLFQQIEELERQIHVMEKDKRSKIPQPQEAQVPQSRAPFFMGTRRLSSDLATEAKPLASRTQPARSSFTSTKPLISQAKLTPTSLQPNSLAATRRSSLTSPKPFTAAQMKNDNTNALHIGDTSPPVQSGTLSPFGSAWRLRTPEQSKEKSPTVPERTRTGSFSAISKLKPPEISTKTSLLGGSSSASAGISNKKHSSSTSDLYNPNVFHSSKPSLNFEDASPIGKSAISSINTTPTSKLPRYQAYTGYQRRSSLTKECGQTPAAGRDKY